MFLRIVFAFMGACILSGTLFCIAVFPQPRIKITFAILALLELIVFYGLYKMSQDSSN